jgi:hypothetical protein
MYLDPPVSKPKTSNSFVSRLNKVFFF